MSSAKRKTALVEEPKDVMTITPLGGGGEVGRSCIHLEYKGKNILLDCGIHPAYNGLAALPFFDEIDPSTIDVLLISHFHLDHAASLPYFMEKTTFKGRVFMTYPTKAIYKWLLSDYVKVSAGNEDKLYDEKDLMRSYERIEAIDYHQTIDVDGIKFTAFNAGHVLGAAMFVIEIAGVKVFYTGDYSREEDRHLMAAERPPGLVPDVMLCESTYGVLSNEPRIARELRFTTMIHEAVANGGRVLIPAFALGRAQELLLILDEYWQAHPELHSVPIYYASALAKKCMAVYQTYVNMMNSKIRKQFVSANPFVFKHISNLKSVDQFDDTGPCVMMASPAMLQNGLSRQLFDRWCTDKKNTIIIPGYVVEGTLAKDILSEPDDVLSADGRKLPLRMKVNYISFSAHVDYTQNSEFIEEMKPINLVLVHGEANEAGRLKMALLDKSIVKQDGMKIYTPRNCESVRLYFRGEKVAKTIGSLATEKPKHDQELQGLLVGKDFQYHILSADDLTEYTELKLTNINQRLCMVYRGPMELVQFHMSQMFGSVEEVTKESLTGKETGLKILDAITITRNNNKELILEWESSVLNDSIADAVVALLLEIESHPASVKMTHSSCSHGKRHDLSDEQQFKYMEQSLCEHFHEEEQDESGGSSCFVKPATDPQFLNISIDGEAVSVDLANLDIVGESAEAKSRIESVLHEAAITLLPLN